MRNDIFKNERLCFSIIFVLIILVNTNVGSNKATWIFLEIGNNEKQCL